jgi:hypothetical protein
MTRTGPTRRNLGNIWMWVSACVLLIPPLVIAADVVVLGFSQPNGAKPEGAARRTAASQATVTESVSLAEQTDRVTSFVLASAEQHAVITEQHSVAGRRPMTAAIEQRPISGQPPVAKDPSRYDAPVARHCQRPARGHEGPPTILRADPCDPGACVEIPRAIGNSRHRGCTFNRDGRARFAGRYAHSRLIREPQDSTA